MRVMRVGAESRTGLPAAPSHGGQIVASVLVKRRVPALFTLCGGHISPILVGATEAGIPVVDCRDEKSAVFAADAVARMTGAPGVAAVTAGPGVTNSLTALKNAQLAQSPVVLIGGATATVLKGRGALQDIDQMRLVASATKWTARCTTLAQIEPVLERAFYVAASGVPGPVFVELPVDLLYPEAVVREWYLKEAGRVNPKTIAGKAIHLYLRGHLERQFHLPHLEVGGLPRDRRPRGPVLEARLEEAAQLLRHAERPALVVGSQAMVNCRDPAPLARAIERLGVPTWLGGMARGLLGRRGELQFRHARASALKEADVAIVCGFPFDFRLKYGMGFGRSTRVVAANLSAAELRKNRRPDVALRMPPAELLLRLAERVAPAPSWRSWVAACAEREAARDEEIAASAKSDGGLVDPIHLLGRLEEKLDDDSIIVADGGDFVATAAYVLRPRAPLSWLDPGVFGTLGVGGGFAVGAATLRPRSEIWILYGDGSSAYSLAEFDTFVRHGLAPIAVVGTDGAWGQIARDQTKLLGSGVGTALLRTAYHRVAEGYGGVGLLLDDPARVDDVLDEAKAVRRSGRPVCVNVHLARTEFREGSISI